VCYHKGNGVLARQRVNKIVVKLHVGNRESGIRKSSAEGFHVVAMLVNRLVAVPFRQCKLRIDNGLNT